MTNTGASSPFIKDEPEDHLFNSMHRFSANHNNSNQQYGMNQQQYGHYGSTPGGQNGSINPNDLSMPISVNTGSYMGNGGFQNFPNQQPSNPNASFKVGNSAIEDDDLLSLDTFQDNSHMNMNGMPHSNQNFNNIEEFDLGGSIYPTQTGAMSMGHNNLHDNIYSSTPDGDPIQSPFVHSYHQQLQQRMGFGGPMQTPTSFQGSPLASELHVGSGENYMSANPRQRPSMSMARHSSDNRSPSILTPKTPGLGVGSLNINANGHSQPIRTSSHRKTPSQQWDYGVSLQSFPGSSPVQPGMHPNPHISEVLKTGSMPAKLNGQQSGASAPAMQTQEMKRRRRRESHNLVERRRRDNINERIQELSHLVPMHRLEDEKVRKALQNNSPLSPVLGGQSMSPPQATSGLAGPGARGASRGMGSVTQGLPVEEKDKGPNKGDILNGSVSWTRDLMWMLHIKMAQMEELSNTIAELGGIFPFELTEDEKRMGSELKEAIQRNGVDSFSYSRTAGTGLRVPKHTDYRGDPIDGSRSGRGSGSGEGNSLSPDGDGNGEDLVGGGLMGWSGQNSGGSGNGSVAFKEEDEYGMDLTQ